jgi:ketosteroid isomerase-like protein
MSDSVEARLRRLEDREAIRELRANYCFLVDDGRFDELVEQRFAEDAACHFRAADGSRDVFQGRGRAELLPFFAGMVAGLLSRMSHTVHNHRISLDGDEASGDCYFELTATEKATGEDVVGAGRYVDRYRRVEGRWLFSERRADLFYIASRARGWSRQPFLPVLSEIA